MEKNILNKKSKNSGITLVALIITIIVLLILAVVAIRAVQGDGIIAHAKNARDNYNEAQVTENGILQNYIGYIEENVPGQSGSQVDYEMLTEGTIAPLRFRSSAERTIFQGVKIDGTTVDSSNYTVQPGSTIVFLNPTYVANTLSAGKHEIEIVSVDGKASIEFEVKPQLFTFQLREEGTTEADTYLCEEGMTWEEWLNSQYNQREGVIIAICCAGGPTGKENSNEVESYDDQGSRGPVKYNRTIEKGMLYFLNKS